VTAVAWAKAGRRGKVVGAALVMLFVTTPARSQSSKPEASVKALLQQARGQSGAGHASVALDTLRRARVLAPNSEDVLSAIAQVSLIARAPLPAIDVLEPLTRICPTVAEYRYLLGVALMQAGDLVAAVDALQQAQRLEPDRELTLVALGLALNGRKLYSMAEPHLRRSLELQPANIEAVAALAEAQEGIGNLEEADTLARRVLASSANHATANLVVGLVLMKQQRYADARDALLKTVAADPTSSRAHYQLSLAYARLGDAASSEKHLELYRVKLRELEERVKAVRSRTGL
jgi:tetratricopeptide (TPR) repeat protein